MPEATRRPLATSAAARRSSMRLLVHEPMNTVSTATSLIGRAGGEAHVLEGPLGGVALDRVGEVGRVGHRRRRSVATWPGLVPQETWGRISAASRRHLLVEGGVVVGAERAPVGDGLVPRRARRRVVAALAGRRRWCRRGR